MKRTILLLPLVMLGACAGTNSKQLSLNLPSVIEVTQPLPTVGRQMDTPLEVEVGATESVAVPLAKAAIDVGQVSLGPDCVKLGKVNGVKLGKWSLTQTLPGVKAGLDVNKEKLFAISMEGGLSLTLPLVKLNVPFPKCEKAE